MAFSAITDAANASGRLYEAFVAELLEEGQVTEPNMEAAIRVEDASFTWDSPPPEETDSKNFKGKKIKKSTVQQTVTTTHAETATKSENIFKINNINLEIPRGALVAIVGPVGSGKSSLLQGLIGEMRKTSGTVTFGGSVGYCSQSAWIQVRTLLMID